jgi:hypothetical protein
MSKTDIYRPINAHFSILFAAESPRQTFFFLLHFYRKRLGILRANSSGCEMKRGRLGNVVAGHARGRDGKSGFSGTSVLCPEANQPSTFPATYQLPWVSRVGPTVHEVGFDYNQSHNYETQ